MEIKLYGHGVAEVVYDDEKKIKIPSQMFPLNRKECKIFVAENTKELNDENIEIIFNSVKPRLGKCYANTEILINALIDGGIEHSRIKTYVGWFFLDRALPVHHCIVVIDNQSILDFGVYKHYETATTDYDVLMEDEMRRSMADDIIKLKDKPNSEVMIFGKTINIGIYIMSECSPSQGIEIRKKLLKTYPNHYCFNNVDVNGKTKLQRLIQEKEKSSEQ